jgi:hypothetical protein
MLRICGWCKKQLEENGEENDHEITHGICEYCRVTLLSSQTPHSIHKNLSYFSLPVMMIDEQGRVLSANNSALELTGKSLESISCELGGDVMSCEYAYRDGGCGENVHCLSCTVRNSVIKTHETSYSLCKVPATLSVNKDGQDMKLEFLISTEKVQDVVLLRIDDISSSHG